MSPQPLRIAIIDDYQQAADRYFPTAAIDAVRPTEVAIYTDRAASREELVRRIGAAEVAVVMRERSPLDAETLAALERTELIITSGTRNRSIDLDAAHANGITVASTRGRDSAPAELTWAILMALMRRIPAEDRGVRDGKWGVHVGETLEHKVLGILGFGRIGRRLARFGQAFGMDVIAYSRSLTWAEGVTVGVEAVSREALFRESDVVSVNLPINDDTRGSIGAREFGWMQPSAVLVNTARGALIDEPAMITALQDGQIAGAALDVFATEPLGSDSPLLAMDNVVLTPHIGYVSDGRYRNYYGQAAEIVAAWVRGNHIRVINPPR